MHAWKGRWCIPYKRPSARTGFMPQLKIWSDVTIFRNRHTMDRFMLSYCQADRQTNAGKVSICSSSPQSPLPGRRYSSKHPTSFLTNRYCSRYEP
ncbi:MAG: hypothetical protein B6D71_06760, partial [gamma proteobacterium symbiont of Stewartia floridana]